MHSQVSILRRLGQQVLLVLIPKVPGALVEHGAAGERSFGVGG